MRFRLVTDSVVRYGGVHIDDVSVSCISSNYTGIDYGYKDGTSMATPHVVGLAGLIKALNPELINTDIKNIILNNVDVKASLSGKVVSAGRINAYKSLSAVWPITPSGLSATADSSSQINLTWTDNSSNETGFKIERKTGTNGTYTQIKTVSTNITSYSDTGLTEETAYYYRVGATNSAGDSGYTAEVSVTTPIISIPTAPSDLSATTVSSSQINLTWTDNSSNETGFKIERKTITNGTYTQIKTVSANITSYSDTGLTEETAYYYRVSATNSGGDSNYSNEANASISSNGGGGGGGGGSSGGGGGGGCFIATVTYGSYLDPHVKILRDFRDKYLFTNVPGRAFVKFYYKNSPPIADYIRRHELLRTITRLILTPIVFFVKYSEWFWGLLLIAVLLLVGKGNNR